VRVIASDGSQAGVMAVLKAVQLAQQEGLDLVEVAPQATPPVCRIIDFGKYKFEISKRSKEAKKKQKVIKVKEVEMRPNIDEHDYQVKLNKTISFLVKDCKVRVVITFQGREIVHKERGQHLIERIIQGIKGVGVVEQPPKMEGRKYTLLLAIDPSKRKELKKGEPKSAKDEIPQGSEETLQIDSQGQSEV
jgi:translation initiation factor IF-3